MRLSPGLALAAMLAAMLGGPPAQAQQENDPLEPINRGIFEFNRVVDGMVAKPLAIMYGNVVPELGRQGIRNFLDNLQSPVIFVNELLQGERERAGATIGRFILNTICGFGIFDVAREAGYDRTTEDFGQTLGVWGVGAGPYLVLPLLGPSTVRDATGTAVDVFVFDPFGTVASQSSEALAIPWEARVARTGVGAIDTRYRLIPTLDDLYRTSLDPYATVRTVYLQHRAASIRNGAGVPQEEYDDIFREDTDQ